MLGPSLRMKKNESTLPGPLKNHKNIGFLSNSGPDPLKISIQCWAIISTPAKRHLNGVSLEGR